MHYETQKCKNGESTYKRYVDNLIGKAENPNQLGEDDSNAIVMDSICG
jgi:hypothetical protein